MADETYVVELIIDSASSAASLRALANIIASVNSELRDPALTRFEQTLVKMAAAADKAATASKGLSGSQSKTAESTAIASKQTAIYNQYLYDEVKALTGVSLSLDELTAGNYEAAKGEAQLSTQTAIANKYLYDQEVALTRTNQSLSTTRYALYSASASAGTFGLALVALAALPVIVSSGFQKEFAQVTRTVAGAGNDTKNALIALSQQIPVSFKDIASIATLGGQLGIQKSGIVEFTKTVAELTATTNLTSEAAGTLLGRFLSFHLINNGQFENLASSILKVGVNTVATETQIATIATRIAGISHIAGLTADQIIGLSGALASVGVQPYAAQGTVTRLFTKIDSAVANSSDTLTKFAALAGVSADTFAKAYGTDRFGPIFQALIDGLADSSRNGGNANKALADLGFTGSTDIRVFTQLAGAIGTFDLSNRLAASGFKNTNTLTDQYAKIAGTTAAQVKILGNNFEAFLNTIGSSSTGPVSVLVGGLNDVLKVFTAINSDPIGSRFESIAAALGLTAGVVILVLAGLARMAAGTIAVTQAIGGLELATIKSNGILLSFIQTLGGVTVGAERTALAVKGIGASLAPLTIIGIGLTLASELQDSAQQAAGLKTNVTDLTHSLATLSGGKVNSLIQTLFGGQGLRKTQANSAFSDLTGPLSGAANLLADIEDKIGNVTNVSSLGLGGLLGLNDLGLAKKNLGDLDTALSVLAKGGNAQAAKQAFDDLKNTEAGQAVSTKELLSLLPQYNAYLKEQAANQNLVNKANKENNDGLITQATLVKTITQLTGLSTKEQLAFGTAYAKSVSSLTDFNSIIKQVQDAQTAAAQAKADSTKSKKDDSSTYYDGLSVSLDQYTKQLVANNGAQQTWLTNLITIQGKAGDAGPAIVSQLIQAGYSVTNASFLQQLIDATPDQLKAYTDATTTSLNLAGQAAAQQLLAGGFLRDSTGGVIGADLANKIGIALGNGFDVPTIMKLFNLQLTANPLVPSANTAPAQAQIDSLIGRNNGRTITIHVAGNGSIQGHVSGTLLNFYANGGSVRGPGSGTSDSIPARLSNGEYVVRASSVRRYGIGLFDQLNRGVKAFAGGGYVGGSSPSVSAPAGMGVTELGPRSLGILREGLARDMSVYLGDEQLARSVRRGNAKLASQGVS